MMERGERPAEGCMFAAVVALVIWTVMLVVMRCGLAWLQGG